MGSGTVGEARKLVAGRRVRVARRSAILDMIERQSSDPQLSAIKTAATLGFTPRYVHMLLQETGRSFSNHLLLKRLEKAAMLLRDASRYDHRIADIALESGFTDLSHFSRAFRQRYGVTPSEMRAAARCDAPLRP
jgi:AraC-like DNA-binding protein